MHQIQREGQNQEAGGDFGGGCFGGCFGGGFGGGFGGDFCDGDRIYNPPVFPMSHLDRPRLHILFARVFTP